MATYVGREQTLTVNGQTYRLSRFTRRLFKQWFEWADSTLPNPLDLAEAHWEHLPQDLLIASAESILSNRRSFHDPAVYSLWMTPEGNRKAFALLLDLHHAGSDCDAITSHLGDLAPYIAIAMGVPPVDSQEIERKYFASVGILDDETEPEGKPMDWADFDRSLFQNFHITPDEADELTPTEITVLCREKHEMSMGEAVEVAKCQLALTPSQLLELAYLKHGVSPNR